MKRKLVWGCGGVLCLTVIATATLLYVVFARTHGSYFDSNGVKIHYTLEGKGEPVILIHGIGANADLNWRRPGVVGDLARDFTVIATDLRGHGLSDRPESVEAYGLELVEDVTRLMDHLKIEKAHIAGYSLGGFIALKFSTIHPDRVRSLAVCAAGWKDPEDPTEIPNPYHNPKRKQDHAAETPHVSRASILPEFGRNGLYGWAKNQITDRLAPPAARKALRKSFLDLAVPAEQIAANKVPMLCVIGDEDGLLPMAVALRDRAKDMEYVLLDGANHFTAPLYPSFKRTLREFILKNAGDAKSAS